jgi:hypothetical protein
MTLKKAAEGRRNSLEVLLVMPLSLPPDAEKGKAKPKRLSGLVRAQGGRIEGQLEKLPADRQEELKRKLEQERSR